MIPQFSSFEHFLNTVGLIINANTCINIIEKKFGHGEYNYYLKF